ncbi:ESAT-6-like protein esxN [Mycobacterium tuberculosis]|nr:ESAT-6-like protein esxN [Mycobacterium tuberculosis]
MTINYQFGDVDAHGAMIRAQAASLEAEHQAIVRDVLAAGDFWGGAGSVACQEFITQLGRNFQVIYEQATAHGQKVQAAGKQHGTNRQRRRLQLGLKLNFSRGSTPTSRCAAVSCS